MNLNLLGKYVLLFIVSILVQVLVLNNISISAYELKPLGYLLFILLLPYETPKWLMLLSSFFLGVFVDAFSNSLGVNSSACVLIAYLRPAILTTFTKREGFDADAAPRLAEYGLAAFAKYVFILVLIHHFLYFFVDKFGFSSFFFTLLLILVNTVLTSILVILTQFFVFKK